jgi:hypothetical protein
MAWKWGADFEESNEVRGQTVVVVAERPLDRFPCLIDPLRFDECLW